MASAQLCRFQGIAHQHRNCQRADAAGHWRKVSGGRSSLVRLHIADKGETTLMQDLEAFVRLLTEERSYLSFVANLIHPDIDYSRARFDVWGADQPWPADGDYQYIGFPSNCWKIASARMANGYSGIALQEQLGRGPPDDLATSDHTCIGPANGNFVMYQ